MTTTITRSTITGATMRIPPTTPVAVLVFAAFLLMLVTALSLSFDKGVPLGSFDGVLYGGLFGTCYATACSSATFGYDPSELSTVIVASRVN